MAPVTLTYTSYPAPSKHINAAISGLRAQLPLRNLHWKPSTRTSLRTILEVDVELVELGDVPTGGRSGLGSVLEQPLVNMCLVVCEDSDTYKNSTRSFIRDWLSLLASRRSAVTPLIVLVNPPTSVAASGKDVFGRDKGILGKLKSDFNTGKRERCVQVNLPPEGRDDPAAWPEMINKIKESIVLAFDTAIVEREEEVKRGEAQRMMVGWNFCTWFLLKESLAHSFEAVGLPSDALVIYEELEATFFQILKEQNLSWFGKLGATSPEDDSLPVLSTKNKPYREMLQGSSISIFDFRIYVFARQASLLGQLGRITEVAKRGQWFVASLTRRLKEAEADLAELFIESWTYTASMDIVQRCDEWSRIDRPNGDYSGLVAYESARSELLDIARVQVERLGVAAGHLPNEYPFAAAAALLGPPDDDVLFESSETGSNPDESEIVPDKRGEISNTQLIEAKRDPVVFASLYVNLTKKAIMAYEACGKINSVIRLNTDLVALSLYKEEWQAAYDQACALARSCAEQSVWGPVARFALEAAMKSHRKLDLPKEKEWTFLALAYLRICALSPSPSPSDQDAEKSEEIQRILKDLEYPTTRTEVAEHEAFSVRMAGRGSESGPTPDSNTVLVELVSKLAVDTSLTDLEVIAISVTGEPIRLFTDKVTVRPGPNVVSLSCRTLVQGLYTIQHASLRLGQVVIRYAIGLSGAQILMRRPAASLSATVRMPYHIALDQEPQVVIDLQSNGVDMKDVCVQLRSDDRSVHYDMDSATSEHSLEASSSGPMLGSITRGTSREVVVPYSGNSHDDLTTVRLYITYTAADGVVSEWTDSFQLHMALPLTVNVQDFFRPECLMSQFTIAADGRGALRLASVELSPPDKGYIVESGRSHSKEVQTIKPGQPLSRIFKIRPTEKQDVNNAAVLRLVIRYMTLEDEVTAGVSAALPDSASDKFRQRVTRRIQQREIWHDRYLSNGWRGIFDEDWSSELQSSGGGSSEPEVLAEFLKHLENTHPEPSWRILEIPVDVPSRRILTSVDLACDRSNTSGRFYEGRAIALSVKMQTTFAWAGEDWREAKMVYDILPMPEDWLVLGKKKGFYTLSEDGGTHETEIVLVPMRSGHLYLPNVVVNLLQPDISDGLMSETYVENAAETLDILPAKGGGVAFIPLEPGWEVEAERRM